MTHTHTLVSPTHTRIVSSSQMNAAETSDEVNALLDETHYMAYINGCGWPATKPVNIANKNDLLQQLLLNEVIRSRSKQMQSFRRGLQVLGFHQLMTLYPEEFEELFVFQNNPVSSEQFLSLLMEDKPTDPVKKRAYDFFIEYVANLAKEGMCIFLMYNIM